MKSNTRYAALERADKFNPRQPLSYQTHPNSCWVTSVLNALCLLYTPTATRIPKKFKYGSKEKDDVVKFAHRLLHAALTDDGVDGSSGWDFILDAIGKRANWEIRTFKEADVEPTLKGLHFNRQVAICDLENGNHSVLVLGKYEGGFVVFDPDWNNILKARKDIEKFVELKDVKKNDAQIERGNLWISSEFFLSKTSAELNFRLGSSNRVLSVISIPD